MAPNANPRKRAVETIDLTEDHEDQPVLKIPTSSQTNGVASSQPTQSQRDSWMEEEDAHETILLSQEGSDGAEETEEYELYGLDMMIYNCVTQILMVIRYAAYQDCGYSILYWIRDYWRIRLRP